MDQFVENVIKGIFLDLGDTLMRESSEVKIPGTDKTVSADLLPGAKEFLTEIRSLGIPVILVMDGRQETVANVFTQHGLHEYFAGTVISEVVGVEKPHGKMFESALDILGLPLRTDRSRVIHIGNRLERDVLGANLAGLTSLWLKHLPTYDPIPHRPDCVPHYTALNFEQAMTIVTELHNGPWTPYELAPDKLPVQYVSSEGSLPHRFAPVIMCDEAEPFSPQVVGITEFFRGGESPSFPRTLILAPECGRVIEYAVWWDMDSGHIYELEHVWVYLSNDLKSVIRLETSQHGHVVELPKAEVTFSGRHPVIYAQPGKHALGAGPGIFPKTGFLDRFRMRVETNEFAGRQVYVTPRPFDGLINIHPQVLPDVKAALDKFAFNPTLRFNKRFELELVPLVAWSELYSWIPERTQYLAYRLSSSEFQARKVRKNPILLVFAHLVVAIRKLM